MGAVTAPMIDLGPIRTLDQKIGRVEPDARKLRCDPATSKRKPAREQGHIEAKLLLQFPPHRGYQGPVALGGTRDRHVPVGVLDRTTRHRPEPAEKTRARRPAAQEDLQGTIVQAPQKRGHGPGG